MRRLFPRTKVAAVRLCARCGEVCDEDCRRAARRERALLQQLWLGARG